MKTSLLFNMQKGLIVSCQALEDEPLYGAHAMPYMALAAQQGGAVGIRANGRADIDSIRKMVDLPIIGIVKEVYDGYPVYITPTLKEVRELADSAADIIAFDATDRLRPGGTTIQNIIDEIHAAGRLALADISTLEEGIAAARLGADAISTTLAGYQGMDPAQALDMSQPKMDTPNYELIAQLVKHVDVPVFAEGHIHTPEDAANCLSNGAYAVVVGAAITRPQLITARFVAAIRD